MEKNDANKSEYCLDARIVSTSNTEVSPSRGRRVIVTFARVLEEEVDILYLVWTVPNSYTTIPTYKASFVCIPFSFNSDSDMRVLWCLYTLTRTSTRNTLLTKTNR